jgi:hypothetical protein
MTGAVFLSILIAFVLIALIAGYIYNERKTNVEEFKKDCLHSRWMHGICRDCGITYEEEQNELQNTSKTDL